jgi:hypothetical protein
MNLNLNSELAMMGATLDGRNENMVYVRRSYMYEFIILFVISVIVLTITIRNLTSDTVTAGGYIICCIILIFFIISAVMYVGNLFGAQPISQMSPMSPMSPMTPMSPMSPMTPMTPMSTMSPMTPMSTMSPMSSGSGSNEGPIIRIHYM